jgi:enterochelin esterase family protein
VRAPNGKVVRLSASDIPGFEQPAPLTKDEDGVWAVTVGPVEPGAYRYRFTIDGVTTTDPRNPEIRARAEISTPSQCRGAIV